jgi:hypothetical protein
MPVPGSERGGSTVVRFNERINFKSTLYKVRSCRRQPDTRITHNRSQRLHIMTSAGQARPPPPLLLPPPRPLSAPRATLSPHSTQPRADARRGRARRAAWAVQAQVRDPGHPRDRRPHARDGRAGARGHRPV